MKKKVKFLNIAIAICFGIILLLLVIHTISVIRDNTEEHITIGNDDTSPVYMDIDFRGDSTSKWQKRDYDLYGESVDITGTTIDETLYNNYNYSLNGWTLQINILGDCFINQAWNGEMEIHQNVGSDKEKVQKLNLQNYNIDDITLEYLYDGDLLIPLHEGDFVVYYPTDKFGETTLESNGKLTIGVIFYFIDSIDLSDYQLNYTYHRGFTQGYLFYIIVFLCFVLFTSMVVAFSTMTTYKAAVKEENRQKQAVSCMSDIYQIIYLINLEKNELIPVHADETSEKLRPKGKSAKEQLSSLFVWDAEDSYQEIMQEFSNLDTVGERLKNKNSIACEYLSKYYGWCSIRIFGMDSEKGKIPSRVLFTIQVIDDEKKELENVKARASKAEQDNKRQTVLFSRISDEIRPPLVNMADCSSKLLEACDDTIVLEYAGKINSNSGLLLTMIDGILDYSDIQSGNLELKNDTYSLNQIVDDVHRIVEPAASNKGLNMTLQVSDGLPDMIIGDSARLKQTLIHLINHMAKCTSTGTIKISVFGRTVEHHVHLLISVVSEGKIFTAKTAEQSIGSSDMDLNIATGIIERMGSNLKIISGDNGIYELYFEIDQNIG